MISPLKALDRGADSLGGKELKGIVRGTNSFGRSSALAFSYRTLLQMKFSSKVIIPLLALSAIGTLAQESPSQKPGNSDSQSNSRDLVSNNPSEVPPAIVAKPWKPESKAEAKPEQAAKPDEPKAQEATKGGEAKPQPPAEPKEDPRREVLKSAVLQLIPAERHYRETLADAITIAYEKRGFSSLWPQGQVPDTLYRPLSLELKRHGMPELMAIDPLGLTVSESVDFLDKRDLAFTIAIADAGTLIRLGAVPTKAIWEFWDSGDAPGNDARGAADIAADLTKASSGATFELPKVIDTLGPKHWVYRELQKQYEGSREAILAYSGLPNIPDPGSYGVGKPNEPYPYAPALAAHLIDKGYLTMAQEQADALTMMTPELVEGLKRFQEDYGLEVDGILGSGSWIVLNTNPADRFRSITINMHRARLLPQDFGERYIIVNLPSAELFCFEKGDAFQFDMRVVHGQASKDTHHTPIFRDIMQEIVFGPYWNVPHSIAKKEILPKAADDWGYLSRNRYEIVSDFNPYNTQTHRLSPDNLQLVSEGRLFFRQLPGPTNALGRIKFLLPNQFNVYLHDTPSKSYFSMSKRDHSHGCVRVSKPQKLGSWVLGPQDYTMDSVKAAMFADVRKSQSIKEDVNTFITYFTTFPRPKADGSYVLVPARDVYGLDVADSKTLAEVVPWKEAVDLPAVPQ